MRVRHTLFVLATAGCVAALSTAPRAYAQQPRAKAAETHAATSRGGGTDENIKHAAAPNKVDARVPAPASKGGEKTRGAALAIVHADNRTNWYISVYMGGSYCGTLSPWGDIYCAVGSGSTVMYARADFDDGTYRYWGPSTNNVEDEFTWRLWP